MSNRVVIGSAAAIIAAMAFFFVAAPIMSAESQYDAAYARIDHDGQCRAAQDAGNAWAMFGPLGRMKFWQDKAETDCFAASVYSRI